MFVRLRPDFSAVAARTHVSDSAVPWRGASTSYDQVQQMCLFWRKPTINILCVCFALYSASPCLRSLWLMCQSSP